MHLHITGICGTFMGGVAQLAIAAGHRVSGSDANVYPPMDGQLRKAGIDLMEGYSAANLQPLPDVVVVGNAISRGNPEVERALELGLHCTSGAQWLRDNVLRQQWVVAIAGTHGKTTTSSMVAWILEYAGMSPGFLIGGVPGNFGQSARAGAGSFFVVEADEYDTAFFDKRSKFVHYWPRTLILNNLEFDHADIFDSISDIQRQFHHLVRTISAQSLIVVNGADRYLQEVLEMGCWSQTESFSASQDSAWSFTEQGAGGVVRAPDGKAFLVDAGLAGEHNLSNAVAAIAAARHTGVPVALAIEALAQFAGVKRRLEEIGCIAGVRVFDDFAHHPTAIAATLSALRPQVRDGAKLIALVDFRSNTMAAGIHIESMPSALQCADIALLYNAQPERLDLSEIGKSGVAATTVHHSTNEMIAVLSEVAGPGDVIVCMSNGSFAGIHQEILTMLSGRDG